MQIVSNRYIITNMLDEKRRKLYIKLLERVTTLSFGFRLDISDFETGRLKYVHTPSLNVKRSVEEFSRLVQLVEENASQEVKELFKTIVEAFSKTVTISKTDFTATAIASPTIELRINSLDKFVKLIRKELGQI